MVAVPSMVKCQALATTQTSHPPSKVSSAHLALPARGVALLGRQLRFHDGVIAVVLLATDALPQVVHRRPLVLVDLRQPRRLESVNNCTASTCSCCPGLYVAHCEAGTRALCCANSSLKA